uniref:WGS project CAEQ00000000 data, annotated contig 1737 n=1 Tax=Trypanosoma congolense (strain IL3000) TaxID=1068625 RepID=F9W8J5_TRYCI|nr:unnamed protein product [Trypanosoma congolense IL3000]
MEEWTRRLVGRAAEQHKYNQLVESAVDERCRERTKFMASCEKAREMWKVWWEKFTSTVIIMDRLLPTAAGFNSNQTPQQAPVQLFPTYGLEDHARSLYLHPSGAVGYPFDWDNEFHKYSTVNYIRYSPIMCNVKADTLTDTDSVDSQKYMQEYAFLCRIAGPSMSTTIHFVSNVYYLRGDECVIAVLLVTGAEVVIIGDSQITSEGEFSIGRHNFHVNWEKALLANIFSDDDASDFLPWKSADSGATRGAILRHSLCFRNLCLDSSVLGSPALMWRFPIGSILRVHQRLFHHRPTATEFQLENGDIYFVVVIDDEFCFSRAKQRELMSAISNMAPHVVTETCSQKANRLSELVDLWRQRRISNRLYLLCLNDIAGRTVADMGQYPVMPWVITDYQSPSIDLKDANIYRDLTKPIGALNDTKAKQLRERYENWLDKSQPPFHHGTHYSSSAVVMYYLIRLQPYTNRSIRYQGGRLDIADRIFHSVPETWNSCGGVGDVKELIPEFFHLPAIFLNKSQVDLGIRSDGMEVGDVVLPSWCGGSVELFVRLQAAALEGEVVSDTLHKWIDLVFGYKQLGKKAVEATNVFLHLSYSDSVEQSLSEASSEEECRAIVATAANFGQTPTQLFKNPHCRRLNGERAPTCQQSFIESVSDLSTRWKSVYYPSNSRHHPGPITSLRIVDTYVAASTQFSLFLPTKPLQVCNYNTISKELHCRPRGESLLLCVLPSVWQHGHGELTAMCVSSLGGIVCLGTTKGKVVVCSRPSAMEPFTILAVLNTCGDKDQQPVKLLKMWDSGHIFVAYENEPQGSLWHVAHSQIMFCFAVNLNHIVGNSVCLRDVTQDRQNGHFFVATHDHVVHLSSTGEVLGTADTSLTNTAGSCAEGMGGSHLPSTAALPVAITSPVSSVEYMNFDSYDKTNVLLLGHENGVLSFWAVETPLDCHSEDVSTKMKPFFSITASTDKPITAIALDGEIISVGTSEGKVISFGSFDPFGENDF